MIETALRTTGKFAGLDGTRIGFSAKEIAAMLDRHVETVYLAIENGQIPATRLGREWLIPAWWVSSLVTRPTEGNS